MSRQVLADTLRGFDYIGYTGKSVLLLGGIAAIR